MTINEMLMWLYTTLSNYNLFVPEQQEQTADAIENVNQQKYSTRLYVFLLTSNSFLLPHPILLPFPP